jgi:hypothetical protein
MRSLRKGEALWGRSGGGPYLSISPNVWCRVLSVLFVGFLSAFALDSAQQNATKSVTVHRANEFSLAGLRPGTDRLTRATVLFKKADVNSDTQDSQVSWTDSCRHQRLTLNYDEDKKIQVIRITSLRDPGADPCPNPAARVPWKSGRGLKLEDSDQKLLQLYGPPDSKSPSTRDGQPLELWYYAFDWAGPDVPQVMEVLCTRDSGGQRGRVVEITLAAPSL